MDERRLWLMVFCAGWILAFGGSFASLYRGGPDAGVGFLGWQAVAGMIALPIAVLGRRWPPASSVRRFSLLPIAFAMLAVLSVSTTGI